MMPTWIFYFFLIELLFVSYFDLMTKKIKNIWSIINLGLFVVFLIFYSDYYPFTLKTFSYSFVFLAVGFLLFLIKIMGPGDTKFLFSFFLITPERIHFDVFQKLLVFTGICAFIFLIFNILKNLKKIYHSLLTKDYVTLKQCFGSKFAFAPVILIAWIWTGVEGDMFAF